MTSRVGDRPNFCSRGSTDATLGDGKGRQEMAEPAMKRTVQKDPHEESVEEILAAARPLPPLDEMIIEDLTEEEERAFYKVIDNL
jgi:hypothetical protein